MAAISTAPPINRTYVIAGAVLVFHVAALWALQAGLLQRAIEVIVPAAILTEFIEPPQPKIEPPPPVPQPQPKVPQPKKAEMPQPPMPVAVANAEPTPNAPVGVAAAPDIPLPPITAPVAAAPTPPAPPRIELPTSDADYLNNPKPAYPALSKRLGEQGKIVVRVLIGADGVPQRAELDKSSDFERLNQTALSTVLKWRFVPGKRAGVPVAMWVNVPINFEIN